MYMNTIDMTSLGTVESIYNSKMGKIFYCPRKIRIRSTLNEIITTENESFVFIDHLV